MIRTSRFLLRAMCIVTLLALLAWSAAALLVDSGQARWLSATLAVGVVALSVLAMLRRGRFLSRFVLGLVPPLVVVAWWLTLTPSNDRDWTVDVSRTPTFTIEGDQLTAHDVRDFIYRSDEDFDPRWVTRTYDLSQLRGVDLFMSYWGPTLYAHTIMSWEFADGSHLAVSIETRKEKGEEYSAVLGFFRQFERFYVVAEERDVVGVRAQHRGEQLFLYRLQPSPELARKLLMNYVQVINRLATRPAWYNALTTNCTTTIVHHAQQLGVALPLDWRFIANGYLDELQYERGAVNTSMPFQELRERSDVTKRAGLVAGAREFSQHLREGLPERPTPR